jgi:hypothetical protein
MTPQDCQAARRQTARIHFGRSAAAVFALGAFVVPLSVWAVFHLRAEGDTVALVHGADAARACLAHHQFTGCPNVLFFPLFQYIPAAGLGAAGLSDSAIVLALAALSALCYLGIVAITLWIVAPRAGKGVAAVTTAAIVAGPLLWYVPSSFGEMLAAFLLLLFLEAVLSRRSSIAVGGTLWLAGITKETALPLLIALGAVALLGTDRPRTLRAIRPQLTGLMVGGLLVFATNTTFNVFRFSSIGNRVYLNPLYHVDGLPRRAQLAIGLWFAPNGGLLVFWPTAVLVGAVAIAYGIRRARSNAARWPPLLLVAVAGALTVGFASWFSPFGWWAWGPRLFLPWIPALVVLAVVIYPTPVAAFGRWVGSKPLRRVVAGAALALVALPHLAALFPTTPDPLVRLFTFTDAECPVIPVIERTTPAYWYGCLNHEAWGKTPVLIDSLSALRGSEAIAFAALLFASFIASALVAPLARRSPELWEVVRIRRRI